MSEDAEEMGATIALPAVLDLAAAETLLVTLRQALAADQPCCLDASNVEKVMLPAMQVILAAMRASEKLKVVNPSTSFCSAFGDAALSWVRDNEAQPAQDRASDGDPQGDPNEVSAQSQPAYEAARAQARPAQEESAALPRPAQESKARTDEPPAAKRILTIDDSKTMRDMLRFTLVDAGYEVLQAVDGQDGLDVLRKERVDVVITDINMPKLDGYGVIRHMRADAGYDDTPILVLSTEGDQKTREIGRDAGATGWLVKPFDPDQLVEIVRQVSP
jgi:two-component system, chemotaxis family, chemotaxis protein CheY